LQDFEAILELKELLREGFFDPFTFWITQPLVCRQLRLAAERIISCLAVQLKGSDHLSLLGMPRYCQDSNQPKTTTATIQAARIVIRELPIKEFDSEPNYHKSDTGA
jgi:hypothetical protein